ncbi:Os03g0555600 [Oryza sativa Japonica Group]|nr:Os03g0555600 [Oryza sativa Japonica Group]
METDVERQEREAEEHRIRQQQEELAKRMVDLHQRGRTAQEAILQAMLGEHDVFMTSQHNIVVAKGLLNNIKFPEDPTINNTIGQIKPMIEAAAV